MKAPIPIEHAPTDVTKCGGVLVHAGRGGARCKVCGYYWARETLAAMGLKLPLTCGVTRDPRRWS